MDNFDFMRGYITYKQGFPKGSQSFTQGAGANFEISMSSSDIIDIFSAIPKKLLKKFFDLNKNFKVFLLKFC